MSLDVAKIALKGEIQPRSVKEISEVIEIMQKAKEARECNRKWADKVESIMRPEEIQLKPYPPKVVTLTNGDDMLIRQATREDIPEILRKIKPFIDVEEFFFDLVAARMYAETLAWKYHRYRNIWFLIGMVRDEMVGVADGRLYNEKIGISLHTLAIKRGLDIGAHLAAAKWEYFFEVLGVDEIYVAVESPLGLNDLCKWKPKLGAGQHELGGATVYIIPKESYLEVKPQRVFGKRVTLP